MIVGTHMDMGGMPAGPPGPPGPILLGGAGLPLKKNFQQYREITTMDSVNINENRIYEIYDIDMK